MSTRAEISWICYDWRMKAVLLAAGQSKRMAPLADKNFLPMWGKPLIQHQIEQLKRCGFKDVIVVGGQHNLQELRELTKNAVEQKKLEDGMAGAVLSTEQYIKNDPFLLLSSNDVVNDSALQQLLKSKSTALLAKKVNSYFPGGYLKVDFRGHVQKIIEKPGAGKEPSNLVNIVAHLHLEPRKLFEALKKVKTSRDDRYEVALDAMMKNGVKIVALRYEGYWQAIKYPWHLLQVWNLLMPKKRISKKTHVAKTAIIRGDVVIEDGVKVFDHAVIQGPSYIGKNSVVANNALIRESHIGANCVIGFSTEIARSYLSDGVWTHSNYIGDSVIGANTSFGSGAVTANLRLDEGNIFMNIGGGRGDNAGGGGTDGGTGGQRVDTGMNKFGVVIGENVRIGVNTSIMPGVKIGNNSFVTSGLCVSQDIPDYQFVYGRWNLEMKENRLKLQPSTREEMMRRLAGR